VSSLEEAGKSGTKGRPFFLVFVGQKLSPKSRKAPAAWGSDRVAKLSNASLGWNFKGRADLLSAREQFVLGFQRLLAAFMG
jgi:hypothetical protein